MSRRDGPANGTTPPDSAVLDERGVPEVISFPPTYIDTEGAWVRHVRWVRRQAGAHNNSHDFYVIAHVLLEQRLLLSVTLECGVGVEVTCAN